MNHKVLVIAALFTTLVGCGTDRDDTPLVQDSNGVASLGGSAVVGETLTASISDNDGVQSGTESYQWFSDGDLIAGATSASYTLTQDEGSEAVTVVVRYTDGSGLRETVESPPVDIQAAFNLGALYVHGLVDGALCEISAVDASGVAASTALASGTTTNGFASFGALVPVDGTALISCNGGTYVDEASGDTLDAPPTRAVVFVDSDATFTVSPLTEIAFQLAEAAGDLNTAVSTHNAAVGINFGVTVSGDITEIAPTDLATTPAANDDAGRYATALALISQLDANDDAASAADIISNLGADLADGTFSQPSLDAFNVAVVDVGTSPVAGNLDNDALLDVQRAINNEPEPAVFENLSATIPNDQVDALTGTVTVTDVNFGEDRVVAQTDAATTYGTFSIAENGDWTYALDTANATVAGLEIGESVNDTIALASVDGTTADLVIRIAAFTQVVKITDEGGDTGEIRFDLDEHLLVGKLTFSFLKEVAVGSDGNVKDAYVALYGNENSNREALIDLRIQGDQFESDGTTPIAPRFLVRNTDSPDYPGDIVTHPFIEDEWFDVEIIWDVDAVGEEVTVVIDGEIVNGGPFQTAAILGDDCGGADGYRANCLAEGVENIQFRFGDNDRSIPFGSFFVDNIVVYDNMEGTGTPVFQDDFENSTLGTGPETSLYRAEVYVEIVQYDRATGSGPVPAQFFDLTAAIDSDSTDVLTGTVTVVDPDPGEAMLVEQPWAATDYGSFTILPSGAWEYLLDTMNPTVAALLKGESVTDTIPIASVDGTTAELVITIRGTIETNTGSDKAARITDHSQSSTGTLTELSDGVPVTNGNDAGEMRYKPAAAIVNGRMTAQVLREAGAKAESPNEDAQIAIYGSSTSTSNAIAYITLDISGDDYDLRDSTGSSGGGSEAGFAEDQIIDFEIAWDATAATDTVAPLVTVTIDGQVAFGGQFSSYAGDLTRVQNGLETIQFRVGGSSDVTAFGLIVDDFKVYSSDSGSEVEVFSDDFESYTVGNSLDPDAATNTNDPITGAVSEDPTPYNSSSYDVFVVETGTATGGLGTPGNQFAITKDHSQSSTGTLTELSDGVPVTNGNDAGEMRYKPAAAIVNGRMTAQVLREAGAKAESPNEDAQIAIYGSSTSTSNAIAYITLDISGDDYDLRDSTGSSGGGSEAGFAEDQIIDFEIAWDATAATDTVAPLVTVTIDGQVAFGGQFSSYAGDLTRVQNGLETIQFRVGGSSDVTAFGLIVDDFKVYSSDSGSEVEVFSDDFESYTVGNSLDPDAATNTNDPITGAVSEDPTPYNSSSYDVFVGEE